MIPGFYPKRARSHPKGAVQIERIDSRPANRSKAENDCTRSIPRKMSRLIVCARIEESHDSFGVGVYRLCEHPFGLVTQTAREP